MRYLPLFIKNDEVRCLVVGGGDIARRKIDVLLKAQIRLVVVAPEVNEDIRGYVDSGTVDYRAKRFDGGDLKGMSLVVAATNDRAVNQRIRRACDQENILVNVVDDAQLSTVIFPAIIDRDPVTVAVSTNASVPALARRVRQLLDSALPESMGVVAQWLAQQRQKVREMLDDDRRRRVNVDWDGILDGPIPDLVARNRLDEAEALFEDAMTRPSARPVGMVSLVGAGPGDPELLTLKALNCIQRADVIYYDNLVATEILERARRDANKVYVGKKRSFKGLRQDAINELLLNDATKGQRVVRLKGGDPFLFGRGGEEISSLRSNHVPFEVVPGITAALGCAAYAGIPLTHRDHAQSVRFVTGQLHGGLVNLDWPELAKPDQTLVIYMGLAVLQEMMSKLVDAGIDPSTPVAVVSKGTLPDQQVVTGTVTSIADEVEAKDLPGPTTTLVGQVVQASEDL